MSSKKSSNQKSKATSTKTKSRRKSSCQAESNLKNNNKPGSTKKILPEHQLFVWLWLAEGRTYQKTADLLKEKFNIQITFNGVYDYQKRHDEEWKEYLTKIKEVRLANAKARILDRQAIANKLKDKIFEILDMSPIFWKDLNVAALIKEHNALLTQIQDESGDKVHKIKADGFNGDFIFGDKTINVFADETIQARAKTGADSGNRLKASRLSDSGNSLSDN